MSYWLEDADGEWLGDLATNRGVITLRNAGPATEEFLDSGVADEKLVKLVVEECRVNPLLQYIADMLRGAKPPVIITDGCQDTE